MLSYMENWNCIHIHT